VSVSAMLRLGGRSGQGCGGSCVNELPSPEIVPGCTRCVAYEEELGATQIRTSAWSDIRVLWRRHQAAAHGITVAGDARW
jgi:hypothetical protein